METQHATGVIARQLSAVAALDADAIMATFAPDAYVDDNGREFRGTGAIRQWVEQEIIAGKITVEVREVVEHHGDVILRAAYDGEFDRSGLPPEVVMSNYFAIRDDLIVSLVICFQPPPAA
jgi:hypothetical protein